MFDLHEELGQSGEKFTECAEDGGVDLRNRFWEDGRPRTQFERRFAHDFSRSPGHDFIDERLQIIRHEFVAIFLKERRKGSAKAVQSGNDFRGVQMFELHEDLRQSREKLAECAYDGGVDLRSGFWESRRRGTQLERCRTHLRSRNSVLDFGHDRFQISRHEIVAVFLKNAGKLGANAFQLGDDLAGVQMFVLDIELRHPREELAELANDGGVDLRSFFLEGGLREGVRQHEPQQPDQQR